MCYQEKHPFMAGLSHESGKTLASMTTKPTLAEELTSVMLKTLNPHNPVLAALVAMAEQVETQDFGVLREHNLVRLPLSLIGENKVRYRTPIVEMLHESILSFNMSDITKENVKEVLQKHGYCLLFLCSCGVVMGTCRDIKKFYGSEDHITMDQLRSAIDAEGNPVEFIDSLRDIPVQTMDLSADGAEDRLFSRISEMLETMTLFVQSPSYNISDDLDKFIKKASSTSKEYFDYVPKYA